MSDWEEYWLRVEADREHDAEARYVAQVEAEDEDYERQAEQEQWT